MSDAQKPTKGTWEKVFFSEDGFSTAGVVVSLLLTLALIFSAAQVYQINSAAANIQNVADAAALAAENEVAEFYIVARLCDAIVLSLSLAGVAALAVGIVALCVPPAAAFSEAAIKAGNDILRARNQFAEKAADGLNKVQKALPFIAAANASALITENSGGLMSASYVGCAVLLPFEGEEITVGAIDAAEKFAEEVDGNKDDISQAAKKAEEAAEKARQEKQRAFQADCGNAPGYCMYERANSLSSIAKKDNPLYQSADAWDFSVALNRAKAYYPIRLAEEVPTGTSIENKADSELRKRFYRYAIDELKDAYIVDNGDVFEAYFPLLPKNTSEMKGTKLYVEVVYPIGGGSSEKNSMHAWEGCPNVGAIERYGSIEEMDTGDFETCDRCQFTVSSFGKVAAASSSIENGFEYHYRIVAESAVAYQKAYEEYKPYADEVKDKTEKLFDKAKEAFSEALSYRIDVAPPGKFGAISLVVNTGAASPSQNFTSRFVNTNQTLGAQVAISASTLVSDSSEEGATIISSLLDGVKNKVDVGGLSLAEGILDIWSSVLLAYTKGSKALEEGIASSLGSIPLASESGLGKWAAGTLSDLVASLGFAPAKLDSPKPVIINSLHVLSVDESSFAQGLLQVKQSYLTSEGAGSGGLFSSIVSTLEAQALLGIDEFGDEIVIASIELLGEGGPSIPLTIALPPAVKGVAKDIVSSIAEIFGGLETSFTGVRRWE